MARELWPIGGAGLALALALAPACSRDAAKPVPPPTATPLAEKPFYRVDRGPEHACASGATCEASVVLTALGDYHVNKDYPFKFVADSGAAAIDGTFVHASEKQGTLTIKFKPSAPGAAKLVGTFKLSVCNADNCEIDAPRLELSIPVS